MGRILPIGILVSGRGSNLEAIISAIEEKRLSAEIRIVVSNNADARAISKAKSHGIPTEILPDKTCPTRSEYDKRLVGILENRGVELVVLAGFMRIMSSLFINAFPMRIINIHPALLPSFPGLNVQDKAIKHGVKFSGCTVHFIDDGVDTGPIIIQAIVPVYGDDTEESLSKRILKEEHRIYPQAIQFFAEGRLKVIGRRVFIEGNQGAEEDIMVNPPVTIDE